MVRTTKGKLDSKKQKVEKVVASAPTGSGTERTSRQQTLAVKKSKEQEKRAGKSVAVPTNEESEAESEDEQVPQKKAKMSKGKEIAVDRDREKTPSVEELYDHLMKGVAWTPTRFADLDLLKELGLESDIEAMLGYLKLPKLLTMAHPTYKDVSCQFLSSLEVTYHDTQHVRQGWGKIKFSVHGRVYNMSFRDIGRVMGFQDLEDSIHPKCEDLPRELWKLITGNKHSISPYTTPGVLPLPSHDIYATFGMVGFFVSRLEHYRDWAWYTKDPDPKIGIGGMITPLIEFLGVSFGKDVAGPSFIDATYLRITTYFSGKHEGSYVYHYYLHGQPAEFFLFDPKPIESATNRHDASGTSSAAASDEPVYGPPRYYFKPHDGVLPPGALCDAHDHIDRLQRWNKAQDRTIEKLKEKCKALSKTVKKQAKTSAKFMKKVADVFTRGGIAGCSSADFDFPDVSATQPRPQPAELGFPLTARQLQRKNRNPLIKPSTSGNKSPSLASSDGDIGIEEVESQPQYADYYPAPGGYYTSFPPHDDEDGPSAFTRSP
ncbi:hypothetical protein Bca101_020772 [Brassica carinata]